MGADRIPELAGVTPRDDDCYGLTRSGRGLGIGEICADFLDRLLQGIPLGAECVRLPPELLSLVETVL